MESASKAPPKIVQVTGDCVQNLHLARGVSQDLTLCPEPGGAWRLAELVRLACGDLDAVVDGRPEDPSAPRSCYLWSLQEEIAGGKAKVWRIREHLGCEKGSQPPHTSDLADPDLVVIEDLGAGYGAGETLWPAALKACGKPGAVLLNTISVGASNPLLHRLLEAFPDRLTVVTPVAALRARRAAISKAVSWDRAIEETVREVYEGASVMDLGRLRGLVVHFGLAGCAVFARAGRDAQMRFDRFLYLPDELEGEWEARRPGLVAGVGSLITAALVRHQLEPRGFPLFVALGRALSAARACHERGGGALDRIAVSAAVAAVQPALFPAENAAEPAAAFSVAFSHRGLEEPFFQDQPDTVSDLLRDLTGAGYEFAAARAFEVVHRGPEVSLRSAPKARYGAFLTVDRQEIERINGIRNLILAYQSNAQDRRPLSIAVFGPPGSGKSFAIKQLAAELFRGKAMTLEFNLSQIESTEDFHKALHQVREGSVRGQIPLVFWDEFDTGGLRWLKEFLAPMQDAEFRSEGLVYSVGKAVFVFAGGTSSEFESFDKTSAGGEAAERFRALKGPDFVSRLRGFVNIKGPNPVNAGPAGAEDASIDVAHLIRRAVMLRSGIQRFYPRLIDPATGAAAIAPGIIRAFLRVRRYVHGARSLEAVLIMSDLSGASYFGPAQLPSPDLLRLHVTPDFSEHVRQGQLEVGAIEALAEACHEAWRRQRCEEGWEFGPVRDDVRRRHPLLRPWADLSNPEKERSRPTARLTEAKLVSAGCRIAFRTGAEDQPYRFADAETRSLMTLEHGIWVRERLLNGYEWAEFSNDALRLHRDLVPFDLVPPEDQALDRLIIESIPPTLWRHGYKIVRA